MDSLVEELNLKQKQVSSLPTTASIISANERRKYVMESDDEHDEAKSSESQGAARSDPAGHSKYSSMCFMESPRRKEKQRSKGRSAPSSPTITFPSPSPSPYEDLHQPAMITWIETSVIPHQTSHLQNEPKTSILSIADIISRYKGAVDDAENIVKERARQEMGTPPRKITKTSPSRPKAICVSPIRKPDRMVLGRESMESDPPALVELNKGLASRDLPPLSPAIPTSRPHPSQPKGHNSFPRNKLSMDRQQLLLPSCPSPAIRNVARSMTAATANSSNLGLSGDSFLRGVRMGQTLLDQGADRDSVTSLRSQASDTKHPKHRRPSSRASKRLSFPVTQSSFNADINECEKHEHARYLRTPHLNRTVIIPRNSPESALRVSYAEAGHPKGHPVLFFLGLGCVRYLIALFDDIARAFNLRLICIDRWGLGKTDQVPQDKRDVNEWAKIVGKVLDEMELDKVQVVAHSAGAPYALATVMEMSERVRGKVHLLAPWVNADIDRGEQSSQYLKSNVLRLMDHHRIQMAQMGSQRCDQISHGCRMETPILPSWETPTTHIQTYRT